VNNYKLTIQYDGTDFFGWQIQAKGKTIQGEITNALEVLLKKKVTLIGAGRTDSGVHALGQTANFKTSEALDIYRFLFSLNSLLPFSIRISEMVKVHENFNSRFDAISRTYFYQISAKPSPFNQKFVWAYHKELDVHLLNNLTAPLLGRHDFAAFTKFADDREEHFCTLFSAKWSRFKNTVLFYIEADRFLHGMVRAIVGTAVNIGKENGSPGDMEAVVNSHDRKIASASAPAKGLFLYKVKYPI